MPVPLDKGYADSGNEIESHVKKIATFGCFHGHDPLNDDFVKVRDVKIDEDNVLFYYFSGAQSKGFARLRNVSKSTFLGQDWERKVCRFSVFSAI